MTPPIQCTADSAGIADLMWAVASASGDCVGECIGVPFGYLHRSCFRVPEISTMSHDFPRLFASLAFISAMRGFFVFFSVLFLDFGVFLSYNRSND